MDGVGRAAVYADSPPGLFIAESVPGEGESGLPLVTLVGGGANARLCIEYIRRVGSDDAGFEYICEFGDTPVEAEFSPATGSETVTAINAHWERVVVEDSKTAGESDSRWGRLRLVETGVAP